MLLLLLALAAAEPGADKPLKREIAERSADPGDKMFCKRFTRTGTLVGGERICKTKRDWEREREAIQQWGAAGATSCQALVGAGNC